MNRTYIEWLDYYENATKEDVIQDMMLDINSIKELRKEIENLKNQLQQKENIIKEVREYIMTELITEWDIKNDGYVTGSDLPADAITPILDIIDKESKHE